MNDDCVSCERIALGDCPACGHVHGESICQGPSHDPYPGNELCECDSSRDHYLMHAHRVCREDMTTYLYHAEIGYEPQYANCINAVVHGYDKCWIHLDYDKRDEYRARKAAAHV